MYRAAYRSGGIAQNPDAEYEERHASAPDPFEGDGLLPAHPSTRPTPVDEIPWKKYSVHMRPAVFSQVRRAMLLKFLFCPQISPQAVHKLCHILHRLSTEVVACWLCRWRNRGYRSEVPVLRGRTTGVPAAAWTRPSTSFPHPLWKTVESGDKSRSEVWPTPHPIVGAWL